MVIGQALPAPRGSAAMDFIRPALWILGPLLAWEIAARAAKLPDYILPLPSEILFRMASDWFILLKNAGISLIYIVEGFLAGAIPAVILGLAIASSRLVERALYPLIVFIQVTPQIAIAPLLTVWFGYGAAPKVLLAAMLTFFPVLVDSATGFKSVDPRLYQVTRSMGANGWQTFRFIKLPAALPMIASGCKISLLISVTVVIVVEYLSSNEGLGFVALRALSNQDLSLMFAAIFAAIGIGLVLNYLAEAVESLLMPWLRPLKTAS